MIEETIDVVEKSYNIQDVFNNLLHRYPFLLVDRIIKIVPGEKIEALKNVSINEQFFCGHFPAQPVMPGVLIVEGLAQTAGLLANISNKADVDANDDMLYYLAGIDNARFKRVVQPGDQLTYIVEVTRARRDIWKFSGTAMVDGDLACSAELLCVKKDQ